MLIVLDTNVLVSALLSAFGAPAQVLDLVLSAKVTVAFDDRLMGEYEEVLFRPRFGFDRDNVRAVLSHLTLAGQFVSAAPLARDVAAAAPDSDDPAFVEVAVEAAADALVTGNATHYRFMPADSLRVLSPANFLRFWADRAGATPPRSADPS
ncbi:MAG: putative toxin-antitoxin system toxin component, PIN family [Anaerolineae bacterium]